MKKNVDMLDEVTSLIQEIKAGWDAIPVDIQEAHQKSEKMRNQDKEIK